MLAVMLAGCGRSADSGEGANGSVGTAGSETKPGATTAMGRYLEEDIPLPGEPGMENERKLSLVQSEDGNVYLYAATYNQDNMQADVLCYEWTGNGWEETISKLHQGALEGSSIEIMTLQHSADGTEYMSYLDWDSYDYDTHSVLSYILKAGPDGTQSLYTGGPLNEVSRPDFTHIYKDGSMLISESDSAVHLNADGSKKNDILQGYTSSTSRTLVAAGNMEYVTIAPEEKDLLRYNMETDRVDETIPLVKPSDTYYEDGALTMDGEGNIYLANAVGIHFWKRGGSIWETVVDGSLNSLSMPSQHSVGMALGYEDDYLILSMDDNGGVSLFRYVYSPDVSSVPTNTLSIFGLADSRTVRQAISTFQKENPDVRVDFQVGDGGDATVTDMIKALNTELVNKKGADILLLDGLPIEDYIEKGVLADLGDLLNPMLNDNELLEQNAGIFRQDNSSVYAVPLRFQYPLIFGTDEGIAAMQSLKDTFEYDGGLPLFTNKNSNEIIKLLMNSHYAELFGEDGMISEENLILLLETAKKIYDRGFDKDIEFDADKKEIYNMETAYGFRGWDSRNMFDGKSALATEVFAQVNSIMLPAEMMKSGGYKPHTVNGIFFPTQIVGVNDASQNKELAKSFIKTLLSYEIQSIQLFDGFPVNSEAFEGWRTYRDDDSIVGFAYIEEDGSQRHVTAEWPTGEQQDEIFALQKEMVTPVLNDRVLMEMIMDEAEAYFAGTTDAAGTAEKITNRAKLYLAE